MRDSWEKKKIEAICEILDSKRIPLNAEQRFKIPGSIPYYGANGIQGYISKYIFDEDLILMAEDGGNFEQFSTRPIAYQIEGKSWVNNHAHILKAKDGCAQQYIFYSIVHKNVLPYIKGGTRSKLNLSDLKSIELVIPPLPQQQKIAQILSTCDAVLEKTETAIAKYQAIKQGLLYDLFTRGIDPVIGKLRLSYEEAPELYKETELGFVLREWDVSNFGNYIVKNLYGPRFSANDYDKKGNVRTIRGMDFSKEGEILYNQTPIASLPISKVNAHLLIGKDIVMVTTADCGLTAVFENQYFDFIPSAYSVKLRFKESVNPYFIKFYMQTDMASKQVNKYVRQGTLGNLPGSDILTFILNTPEKIEQDIIVDRIESIDQKIECEQRSLGKYQAVKTGLMQDLLSGVVGVEGLIKK